MAPHVVLEEVGADYRLVRVRKGDGGIEPPELELLNPHRRVPVLVDGDLVLYESVACVMHLCDTHPDVGLAPALGTSERALWYRWLTYLTNTVQATFMIAFYPMRATADPGCADAARAKAEADWRACVSSSSESSPRAARTSSVSGLRALTSTSSCSPAGAGSWSRPRGSART